QDRLGGPEPGLRHPGLPGRHPHPPSRRPLGALLGEERRRDRAGPETPLPRGGLGASPPLDHLLRPRVLSRPLPRLGRLAHLLLGGVEEAEGGGAAEEPAAAAAGPNSMKKVYTAVVKQDESWWIGWIEEVPGVNC